MTELEQALGEYLKERGLYNREEHSPFDTAQDILAWLCKRYDYEVDRALGKSK